MRHPLGHKSHIFGLKFRSIPVASIFPFVVAAVDFFQDWQTHVGFAVEGGAGNSNFAVATHLLQYGLTVSVPRSAYLSSPFLQSAHNSSQATQVSLY